VIHILLARSAAAMAPPPPVQRKAICRPVIAVRSILPVRAIATLAALAGLVVTLVALAVLRRLLRLTAGNKRGQPIYAAFVFRSRMLGTRLKLLRVRLLLRVIVLLLIVMVLFARIILLRLTWGERLAPDMRLLVVSLVISFIGAAGLAGLLLLVVRRLTLPKLLLRRGDQSKIMLSVLVIVFRRNWIARALRVAGQLEIFFPNVGCRSANFYIRSIGLVHSGQWILMMMMMVPTFAITTAHTFVLTVSHGFLFRQPLLPATARLPPLLSTHRKFVTSAERRIKFPVSMFGLDVYALVVTS
jgi:hypothetical protein